MVINEIESIGENEGITHIKQKEGDIYLLTETEKKLLEVLVNPENFGKSVVDKCQLAGISRDSYYKFIKKKEFITILNETSIDVIKAHVSEILMATLKHSLKDPKCHSDRKMLLQMAGLVDKDETAGGSIILIKID
jgi:hypothetical protein